SMDAKHDVPENGGHAVIAILEAMMREVPHLCAIQPGVRLYRPAMHGIMDDDEGEIAHEKSGDNRRPIFHAESANQQKSNRQCNERRTEAGSFCIRIVWMVMMQQMKAPAHRMTVEEKSVHQVFQQRPGRDRHHDQMEAIDAGQFQENHGGKRDRDEVAEVSDPPHQPGGQARYDSRSPHWITSPPGRGFSFARWTCRMEIRTALRDETACSILALA